MKRHHTLVMQATEALNSRLFVILAAQQNGWTFAKKLQFLEAGIYSFFFGYTYARDSVNFLSIGGGENENYMKVAKEFQKRQDKKDDEKELRGLARAKPYTKSRVQFIRSLL